MWRQGNFLTGAERRDFEAILRIIVSTKRQHTIHTTVESLDFSPRSMNQMKPTTFGEGGFQRASADEYPCHQGKKDSPSPGWPRPEHLDVSFAELGKK